MSENQVGTSVTPYGVMIAVKRATLCMCAVQICSLPSNMARRLLSAKVRMKNSQTLTMWINTVHLESLANENYRVAQMKLIFEDYMSEEKQGHETMLMGDFNFGDNKPENGFIPKSFMDCWLRYAQMKNIDYLKGDTCCYDRLDRLLVRTKQFNVQSFEKLGKVKMPSDHLGICIQLVNNQS